MRQLRILLLGSPQIECDGRPTDTDRRKAVALLAYLAVTAVPHTRDALATLFWPDSDQSRALAYLRRALWEVNNILGEGWLEAGRDHIALRRSADVWLDVAVFQALLAEGGHTAMSQAIDLYRGDFMAGFSLRDCPDFDEWQYFQAETLRRTLGAALESVAGELAAQGEMDTAVNYSQRWLTLDPLNEAAHRQLMRLYAQSGRRSMALRQYQQCMQRLQEELGVTPEPETTALYETIKAGRIAHPPPDFREAIAAMPAVLETAVSQPSLDNLPLFPTPFVGRRRLLQELGQLLHEPQHRLVTLVGPGGMGKTRLAIQLAQEQRSAFADGVCFVPLAPLESARQMVTAVARALHFTLNDRDERSTPRQQLLDYLTGKQLLLILDNMEHLVEGLGRNGEATLPQEILAAAPQSKIITTSRARLNVRGETLVNVTGMDVPAMTVTTLSPAELEIYSSLKLFALTASRIQPEFQLTPENLGLVTEICRLVEGMPLAIELAASWLELLSLAEIKAEITRNLDFLETELQDVPERQRSIRAVFESTWKLLTPAEQETFSRLAIFVFGFTRQAAQAVTGASLRVLMGLVNKSLIRRGEDGRYTIHELLRQYALAQLRAQPASWQQAQAQYSDHFLRFLLAEGEKMSGPEQVAAFTAVDNERANIQNAWRWAAVQGQYDRLHKTLPTLYIFYQARSFTAEDMEMLNTAVRPLQEQNLREQTLFLLKCRVLLSWFAYDLFFYTAETNWRAALQLSEIYEFAKGHDLTGQMGFWLSLLGLLFCGDVNVEVGVEMMRQAYEQVCPAGQMWEVALAAHCLSQGYMNLGNLEEAAYFLAESLQLNQETENLLGLYRGLDSLTFLHVLQHNYATALQTLERIRPLVDKIGHRMGDAYMWWRLANTLLSAGEHLLAAEAFCKGRDVYYAESFMPGALSMASWAGIAFARAGELAQALALRQESLNLPGGSRNVLLAWHQWEMGDLLRIMGDRDDARQWYTQSRALMEQLDPLGVAYYYRGMGDLALADGRETEAIQHYETCYHIVSGERIFGQPIFHDWTRAYVMAGQARAMARLGQGDEARALLVEALRLAHRQAELGLSLIVLVNLAAVCGEQKQWREAVTLAAFALEHKATWHEFRRLAEAVLSQARQHLTPAEVDEVERYGRSLSYDESMARWLVD
ncbi:MAG TPA: BTAD domain-containing putative transcriptional regulator [Chloroflexota bacterium]|nr:BTAD domain-containing putative transcriptional regulator [Chloroflexota bacterium]HUM70474.1 BTAD domain-containing putative transcriptional regulator [Chloroflexota bacterium]